MIVALDVDYQPTLTRTGFVCFADWTDEAPAHAGTLTLGPTANVTRMAGAHPMPTLLRRVDQLARGR